MALMCAGLAGLGLVSTGCGPGSDGRGDKAAVREGRPVAVAAASDLRYAFEELAGRFHRSHPGIHVSATYGSSGNFYAQLQNQAPFDLFLSADAEYPRRLEEAGLTLPESRFSYGVGRIAVWAPAGSPIDVEKLGMAALTQPSVRHVAIANPRHAPYGRAAEGALKSFGIYETVAPRLVLGENVAQTLQFVESGSADIGIVALSLALAPPVRNHGRYWEVPADRHPRLEQVGVILRWAKDREAAGALRAFLAGAEGKRILADYGFLPPEN
ncbi:MAG: molybdate ABC transporter substrate-binding protein [Bryobacterales bacterium]|nr:molybdate ABC transporter substrate-binding protein [Bryobacterales bacterium]